MVKEVRCGLLPLAKNRGTKCNVKGCARCLMKNTKYYSKIEEYVTVYKGCDLIINRRKEKDD